MDPILGDYTVCDVPAAREAAVLSLFETIVKKLQVNAYMGDVTSVAEVANRVTAAYSWGASKNYGSPLRANTGNDHCQFSGLP